MANDNKRRDSLNLMSLLLVTLIFGGLVPFLSPVLAEKTIRQATTVFIKSGDEEGSGIIVKKIGNGYLVVTNKHVVEYATHHCIKTSAGKFYNAFRVPTTDQTKDLAFLWFSSQGQQEAVAKISILPIAFSQTLPIVVATGYPNTSHYTERVGLLIPLLNQTLDGGYSLSYTSDIEKGMSGGGIFDEQNYLIGINGIHQDALWDLDWKNNEGKTIENKLSKKLNTVALGINVNFIKKELNKILYNVKFPINFDKKFDNCK
jgi:S1-C subfamily serine protease